MASRPDRQQRSDALGRTPLARLRVWEVRRAFVTTAILLAVLGLFAFMVHELFVAAVLGAITAIYLRPVFCFIEARTGSPALAAVVTILLLVGPTLAVLVYGYLEVRSAAEYLAANTASVAAQIDAALDTLPFLAGVEVQDSAESALSKAADLAIKLPQALQGAASEFAVDTSVYLFTAFYVFTQADTIVTYLRGKVPVRYAELAERMEENVSGVLYGAIYGTLVTQTLKSVVVFVLMLAFGVPLAPVLALAAFIIGFFPVVGSWTVFVPAGIYLLVFQNAPWQALSLIVLGLLINTVLFSLVLRPKLASAHSHVLDFYWMFVGLIAGVYSFGVPGIVLGPMLVGLLKAFLDTLTADQTWKRLGQPDEEEQDGPKAEVLAEEKLREHQGDPDDGEPQDGDEELGDEPDTA